VAGHLILSLETATGCGGVSLSRGGRSGFLLLAECTIQQEITHSRRLLGSVAWLLAAAGVEWSDLDGVAVSCGPGSFTGLRIGMAAAKAMVMATGKPFIGVPTLDALAQASPKWPGLICCLLDARKQEVYAAFYRMGESGLPQQVSPPAVRPPAGLLDGVAEPVLLVGPGAVVYKELWAGRAGVTLLPEHLAQLRAPYVGLLAADLLAEGRVLDPAVAAPLYVRASEAEINLQQMGRHA
jgi:tRNA threonylcarbamoyladenosine biosynthesis protein TsaB